MKYLALKLPGGNTIDKPPGLGNFTNLADLISPLLNIAFYIALFLAFAWISWGAFAYILAQGKKEDLQKARSRIIWALVGMAMILLAYSLAIFLGTIFSPTTGGLPF